MITDIRGHSCPPILYQLSVLTANIDVHTSVVFEYTTRLDLSISRVVYSYTTRHVSIREVSTRVNTGAYMDHIWPKGGGVSPPLTNPAKRPKIGPTRHRSWFFFLVLKILTNFRKKT
jgi:hypothetical protein